MKSQTELHTILTLSMSVAEIPGELISENAASNSCFRSYRSVMNSARWQAAHLYADLQARELFALAYTQNSAILLLSAHYIHNQISGWIWLSIWNYSL